MTADEFNAAEIAAGRLQVGHVTAMVRMAQAALGLDADGKCGPKTRTALEAQASPLPTGPRPTPLGERVAAFAATLLGLGEEGANNQGSFIIRIGGQPGYEWCALTAGYCWREASQTGDPAPAWAYRHPGTPEPGALALAAACAADGQRLQDPSLARPGDLLAWDHGGGHGHVGLVEMVDASGLVHTIEGNVGHYPAKVKRLTHDVRKEPQFWGFARPSGA